MRPLRRSIYPYNGTSGWSGTDTSRARAIEDDRTGLTRERHQQGMVFMTSINSHGYTWGELSDETGWHHGVVSGFLTRAHRIGDVARLEETRGSGKQSKVYVHRDFVHGRPTEPYRPKPRMQLLRDVRALLAAGEVDAAIDMIDDVIDPPNHGNQRHPTAPPSRPGAGPRRKPRRGVRLAPLPDPVQRWLMRGRRRDP